LILLAFAFSLLVIPALSPSLQGEGWVGMVSHLLVFSSLVVPAAARAGARANSEAGPKGEYQEGASQAGIQLDLSFSFSQCRAFTRPAGERVTFLCLCKER
jgi:hypothetical protein